ncbi:MAG: DegV family protein [Clostridia bacterium]|nr:DegV family protein [Clostridia bacterium]
MSKILLMTDSGSDIGMERADKYGIRVLPLKYSFDGEKYYLDGIDQTAEEFYAMEKVTDEVPKTAQISPLEFEEAFEKAYEEGYDTVIYTSISGKASGTCQNAMMMGRQVMDAHEGFKVEVIDSLTYSVLYGFAVIEGAKLLKDGKNADEIIERIKKICYSANAYFVTDDLTHLKKGGRINAATFAVANMLDIKPVLVLKDGLVEQGAKLRGSKNLYKKLVDSAKAMGDFNEGRVFTIHTCVHEKAAFLRNAISEQYPNIIVDDTIVGPTIGCHTGPDLFGIVYFGEKF